MQVSTPHRDRLIQIVSRCKGFSVTNSIKIEDTPLATRKFTELTMWTRDLSLLRDSCSDKPVFRVVGDSKLPLPRRLVDYDLVIATSLPETVFVPNRKFLWLPLPMYHARYSQLMMLSRQMSACSFSIGSERVHFRPSEARCDAKPSVADELGEKLWASAVQLLEEISIQPAVLMRSKRRFVKGERSSVKSRLSTELQCPLIPYGQWR